MIKERRQRSGNVPHLTKDTTWESNKKYHKYHQQEPRGQPFDSRWPQGSNEQTQKKEKHKTHKAQMIHKRSTALEKSVKNILPEGLNQFHCANLTLSSDGT